MANKGRRNSCRRRELAWTSERRPKAEIAPKQQVSPPNRSEQIQGSTTDQHSDWSPNRRIVIEQVQPEIDGGRFALKRVVGDTVEVMADIYRDGHDKIRASILYRAHDESGWSEAPMSFWDNDRWRGRFPLDHNARYFFTIEAWTDHFESWRDEVTKKHAAGVSLAVELIEGATLVANAAPRVTGRERDRIVEILTALKSGDEESRVALLLSDELAALMTAHPDRSDAGRYPREIEVYADREKAQVGTWYEMFQRSQGTTPGKSSTFDDCARRLPEIQAMGFDVVYFVPIHPIGRTHRKGPDNTLNAGPNDPGSPYAIGSDEGGHTAIHPDLGTLEDFRRFVKAAHEHGMEVAIDFAIQCSPDHPWLKEHPNWFVRPSRRINQVRREPAQEVPGYRQHRLLLRRARCGLGGVARRRAVLGRTGRQDLPRRQPAYQARPILGMDDPRGPGATP